MYDATPASVAPGPFSSVGIKRATAASMNDASFVLRNEYVVRGAGVSFGARSHAAVARPAVAAPAAFKKLRREIFSMKHSGTMEGSPRMQDWLHHGGVTNARERTQHARRS